MGGLCNSLRWVLLTILCGSWLLVACSSGYEVTGATGSVIPIDTTWDAHPDAEAVALLESYKNGMDSLTQQIGTAAVTMDKQRPEDLLPNLVADVLREAASQVLGHPADMGLINIGGIRNTLPAGAVTLERVCEILPFENALCVLTLSGSTLKELFADIARRKGEGVSGVCLHISREGNLLDFTVNGKKVTDGASYTVATIDYLAEGNDGMTSLPKAEKRQCVPGATLRELFVAYVKQMTAQGKLLTSRKEGRIVWTDK